MLLGLSITRRLLLALSLSSKAATTTTSMTSSMPCERMIRVILHGGDNMLGRAVQLTFPVQAPGEELIRDSCSARYYLDKALHSDFAIDEIRKQNQNQGSYLWDKSRFNMNPAPDLCLLNLETAVTKSISNNDIPRYKGINYHMHVDNFETIMSGFPFKDIPVVLCYANNHSMDYGRIAFEKETLPFFRKTNLVRMVGCGNNIREASKPVLVPIKDVTCEIFAVAAGCSGTPRDWWASESQSGLVGLPPLVNERNIDEAIDIVQNIVSPKSSQRDNRIRILSIHWGPNWALKHESSEEIQARRKFAHRLIDECGIDLIYGHSSHHIRGLERYKGKLIMYGAGDIINDYEGFENVGEEKYNRLGGVFVVDLSSSGDLRQLQIVPMLMNQLRLERVSKTSKRWDPNKGQYEQNEHLSHNLSTFINGLSKVDAGGEERSLILQHKDSDEDISGGLLLYSDCFH